MKRLDCHVHYGMPIPPEKMISFLESAKTDMYNLVLVPDWKFVSNIADAMVLKDMAKDKCYVFSSLDVTKYFIKRKSFGKEFAKYTKFLMKMGADGIKIIEGKPNMRKVLPIPNFDSEVWDPFWDYCEKNDVPILMHLNDPEEFWDPEKAPEWAKKNGWTYDNTFPNNEDQYNQMLNVLKKHPNLKICFAHFFFMSKQLQRLRDILDTYKNVRIDLTPGIEMYLNFQDDMGATKQFFLDYQDRILYGTDIGARAVIKQEELNEQECIQRTEVVRGFLEQDKVHVRADGNFLIGDSDFDIKGLKLDDEILNKIYYNNFVSFVGSIRPINKKLVIRECNRLKFTIMMMSMFQKHVKRDFTFLNKAIYYFKKKGEKN